MRVVVVPAGQYSIDARVLKDLSLRQVRSEQRIKKVEEALVTIVMQMKIERYERMMGQRDLEQASIAASNPRLTAATSFHAFGPLPRCTLVACCRR